MRILAIETSCDETAVAVLEAEGGLQSPVFNVRASVIHSQVEVHAEYGGVYPNLAKREHSRNLVPVLKKALELSFGNPKSEIRNSKKLEAISYKLKTLLSREPELLEQFLKFIPTIEKPDIDAIAVTEGPGLEPALWVGINFAKALSLIWDIPVIPVNHMEGHIVSVLLDRNDVDSRFKIQDSGEIKFPAIALLVSGGHTELVLVKRWGEYEVIGATRDDAAGEAFDKVARILGLPYPGGPQISRLANQSRNKSEARNPKSETNSKFEIQNSKNAIKLPRPMIDSPNFDFSFSGLKTAVLYLVRDLEKDGLLTEETKAEIAREFEDAVADVLVSKTMRAVKKFSAKSLILGGGVTANTYLRKRFKEAAENEGELPLHIPQKDLSTDNAVMIGMAGYLTASKEGLDTFAGKKDGIRARGTLSL